jgi:hypothetical protein
MDITYIPMARGFVYLSLPAETREFRKREQGGFVTRQLARELVDLCHHQRSQPEHDHRR